MALKPMAAEASLIDVLDRVLDKGIVIDAWMRVSVAGLDLVQVKARVVVASIKTYLTHAGSLDRPLSVERESLELGRSHRRLLRPVRRRSARVVRMFWKELFRV